MRRHTAPRSSSRRQAPGTLLMALAVIVGLAVSGGLVWRSTEAAFTATTATGQNTWHTGTVVIRHDAVSVPFTAHDLTPGTTGKRCISVTYDGTVVPVDVRLYAADPTGGALGDHITLTVWEGAGGSTSCTGFLPAGNDPIYSGGMTTFAAQSAGTGGVGWWSPAATGEVRTYEFSYTVGADAPQSSSYGVSFVWEARS